MRQPPGRLLGILTVALFLTYLGQISVHLVHHLFDQGSASPTCPFFAQSQHTPELQPDAPSLPPPLPVAALDVPRPAVALPPGHLTPIHSRAPPSPTPSV